MPKRQVNPIDFFPARPRSDGRYQKRIHGVLYYFGGPGIDREGAQAEYQRVRRALYERREPAPRVIGEQATLRTLASLYNVERRANVEAGIIRHVTYTQGYHALLVFLRLIGADRPWTEIQPTEYSEYCRHLGTTYGDYAHNHHLAHVTAFFNACVANGWIPARPNLGPLWRKKTPRRKLAPRSLTPAEVAKLLKHAKPQLQGMLLLGLNAGMGPADCAELLWEEVKGGVVRQDRPKTGISRLAPLWPITSELLASLPRVSDNVFTTQEGQPWQPTSIAHEFRKVVTAAKVDLPSGLGLYLARHTFSTLADGLLDVNGKRRIMGHALMGMDRHYVNLIGVARLRRITDHVRRRLRVPGKVRGMM